MGCDLTTPPAPVTEYPEYPGYMTFPFPRNPQDGSDLKTHMAIRPLRGGRGVFTSDKSAPTHFSDQTQRETSENMEMPEGASGALHSGFLPNRSVKAHPEPFLKNHKYHI